MSTPQRGWLTRLAEADAELPDAEAAARVVAAAGPEGTRVLDALAAVRADLAAVPRGRMPRELAGRLAEGLDGIDREGTEPSTPSTSHRRADARPTGGPPRRPRRPLLLTAAAAALVVVALVGPSSGNRPTTDLASATARVLAEGTRDVGDLVDPGRLASCLVEAGVAAPAGPLLAGRPVVVGGREGTLLVLGTGTRGRVRAVVPVPGCGRVLADLTLGG